MFKYVETVSKFLQMSLMSGGGAAAPVARGPPKETMFEEMARKVLDSPYNKKEKEKSYPAHSDLILTRNLKPCLSGRKGSGTPN